MTETSDLAIFWIVVALRFLVPLAIPKYPLPGIVASLVIDGVDQTVFQSFTNLQLDGYQGYDKALDIYYLTVGYISTLRNWTHLLAFRASRFLFYYRLVGVVLFEVLHIRTLLLIFPNVFEYFFIFYEAVRSRWNPLRMTKRFVLGSAAFIWIVVKMPQEYWIHIAQLDATDAIKETIFGVSKDASWGVAIAAKPWIVVVAAVVVALLLYASWWIIKNKLPPADWSLKMRADDPPELPTDDDELRRVGIISGSMFNRELLEKLAMTMLVSTTFGLILDVRATPLEFFIAIGIVVIVNTGLSHYLAQRSLAWSSSILEFCTMAVFNFVLILTYAWVLPEVDGVGVNLQNALFFVLLLTLLITLYDRYRPYYLVRVAQAQEG